MNNMLKTDEFKKKKMQRGLIVLALLFAFGFILYSVLSLRTEGTDGSFAWGLLSFDTVIRNEILQIRNPFTTSVMSFITWFGDPDRIIVYCVVLLVIPKTRLQYGVPVSIASYVAVNIQTLMKAAVMRPRPDVSEFLITQGGFSFPSGHSCAVLVFFWFLAFLILKNMKKRRCAHVLGGICIGIVPLIGFSRLYLGVHYPTDIIGGWCLGTAILLIVITIYEVVVDAWRKRKKKGEGNGEN